jgi:hypothetical protein
MDIPPNLILPQDMIDVTDLGPPDPGDPPNGDAENLTWRARKAEHDAFAAGGSEPVVMRMHIVDAKHAMDVEPTRYALAGLKPEPEQKPEIDPDSGPTVEEWVAAGYKAINYPPSGYTSKSTPEEIEAAIAAENPSLPAAPPPEAPPTPPEPIKLELIPDEPGVTRAIEEKPVE